MFVKDFSKAALCCLAWFFLLEAGIRVEDPRTEMYMYVHDGLRGWAFPKNGHGWANADNATYVQLNSAGFNDREHTEARRPGLTRIAVLGDSMTAETMLPRQKIFTSVMEQNLPGTEVMNFGVNAYNLEQCRRLLEDVVWKFDPQIILILITFENGIAYNLREFGYGHPNAPYQVLRNGVLAPDAATAHMTRFGPKKAAFEDEYAFIANTSRMFLLFDRAFGRVLRYFSAHKREGGPEDLIRETTLRSYFPQISPEMAQAWDVSERMLILIQDQVRAHHAEFWIAVPGLRMQTVPDLSAREAFRKDIGADTLYMSNDKLARFCASQRIPLIDMSRTMGDYAVANKVPLYGFGADLHGMHWNEQGNLAAGKILARAFAQHRSDLHSTAL